MDREKVEAALDVMAARREELKAAMATSTGAQGDRDVLEAKKALWEAIKGVNELLGGS